MRRRLFNALVLLSLTLCAAVAVAWPISYCRAFGVERQVCTQDGKRLSVRSSAFNRGRLTLSALDRDEPPAGGAIVEWRPRFWPAVGQWSYAERFNIGGGTLWRRLGVQSV